MMLTCCKPFFFLVFQMKIYTCTDREIGGTIYLLALGALEHTDDPGG